MSTPPNSLGTYSLPSPSAPTSSRPPSSLKPRTPSWVYASPLAFTALPLIRIAFKHNAVVRDRLFYGACFAGIVHGFSLMTRSYDYREEEN
jgi:hypothetical protein